MDILTVSELTFEIKSLLESGQFFNVAVLGEISNFKAHSSGHLYFTLKDEKSRLKAVMFKSRAQRLAFAPENGNDVVALGTLGVYEANGEYQLYVDQLLPQGIGALHLAFEQLRDKLEREGLFAEDHKRPLPTIPQRVAVITSPTGAALRDILSVIYRRFPTMNVVIVPVLVQGDTAPHSIVRGLNMVNQLTDVDVAILARGGGSMEELWAFNDEAVARSIFACKIPVISGIGHETDFTIADFVADRRAATPSAAAELVVPNYTQLRDQITTIDHRLAHSLQKLHREKDKHLKLICRSQAFRQPQDRIRQERQRLDELLEKASQTLLERHQGGMERWQVLLGSLHNLSPLATLSRGYAVCQDSQGNLIRQAGQVEPGDRVKIRLSQGNLQCLVEKEEG